MTKIVYTKHAEQRVSLRRLSRHSIEETIANPDRVQDDTDGKRRFIKRQGTRLYHVVARYNPAQKAWVVISVWVRGEEDPQNYLWLVITWPFKALGKALWWLIRLLFSWSRR